MKRSKSPGAARRRYSLAAATIAMLSVLGMLLASLSPRAPARYAPSRGGVHVDAPAPAWTSAAARPPLPLARPGGARVKPVARLLPPDLSPELGLPAWSKPLRRR